MAKPSDKEIAARAYKLWEQNGQPEGRDEEFWRLAEQELLNDDKSSPMRTPDLCKKPRSPRPNSVRRAAPSRL